MGSCGRVNTGYQVAAITVKYMGNPPNGNPNLAPLCAPQYCILGIYNTDKIKRAIKSNFIF